MNDTLRNAGRELVEASRGPDVRPPYGIMDELFPFVFEASERMSIRAICRWLESKGVSVSPMTVSRALRKPDVYWQKHAGRVEPWALLVARGQDVDPAQLLFDRNCWEAIRQKHPKLRKHAAMGDTIDAYRDAVKGLAESWFVLSDATMAECRPHFSICEEEGKGTKHEDGK